MIEKQVDIGTADGVADCVLFYPDESGQWPGAIMYPDIGGLRPVTLAMAKRLASEGFVVLTPNAFYRASRLPVYREPFKFGDERTTARMGELRAFVTPANVTRDASAFVNFLAGQKQVRGKIGVVGYCMGGNMAMRAAAAEPDKVAAVASFHGSNLASADPDSPHTLAPKIKAKMHFGFAIEDRTMPPEAVERLKSALDAANVRYEAQTYAGARHGWCVQDHSVYHEAQAEHAWQHLVSFFRDVLR